jgi:hypothetical protein
MNPNPNPTNSRIMKTALRTTLLVLLLTSAPLAQAKSAVSVIAGATLLVESAIRLIDTVVSGMTWMKGKPVEVSLNAAVELVEWHRVESSEYLGQTRTLNRKYIYNRNTGQQEFKTYDVINGKVRFNSNPFMVYPLEIRKFRCAHSIASDPRLRTECIDAGFVLAGSISAVDLKGVKGTVLNGYDFTLFIQELPMPSGCGDVLFLPRERRLGVTIRPSGSTFFTLNGSGSNCSYNSLPGIVFGTRQVEGTVIEVGDPYNSLKWTLPQ